MADLTYYYPSASGAHGNNADFRWEVTEHNDILTNSTTLIIKFQTNGNPLNLSGLQGGTITIEITDCFGNKITKTTNGKNADAKPGTWRYIRNSNGANSTINVTLPHNDDGTSWFNGRFKSYSAGDYFNGQYYQIVAPTSALGKKDLQTNPRNSILDFAGGDIGSTQLIEVTRYLPDFRDTITYSFGSLSGTIATKTSETNIEWTIPTSFYGEIPNSSYGVGTLSITSYSGDDVVGTHEFEFTATVNRELSEPTLAPTAVDTNATTIAATGNNNTLVKGHSTVAVATGAQARNSATLTAQQISGSGQVINSGSGTIRAPQSGEITFTATDSRGFTASQTITKDFIDYINLTCNLDATRPTTEGNSTLSISGLYFSGSFGAHSNTLSVKYRYRSNAGYTEWADTTATINAQTNSYTATVEITGLDYRKTWVFQAKATDLIMADVLSAEIIRNTIPVFDWGKDDFHFSTTVNMDGDLSVGHYVNTNSAIFGKGNPTPTGHGGHLDFYYEGGHSRTSRLIEDAPGQLTIAEKLRVGTFEILGGGALADYVVEDKTSGKWKYRKWNSGRVEAWYDSGTTSITVSSGGTAYYRSSAQTVNIPSGLFTAVNNCTSQLVSTNLATITINSITTTQITYQVWKSYSGNVSANHIYFTLVGTWK